MPSTKTKRSVKKKSASLFSESHERERNSYKSGIPPSAGGDPRPARHPGSSMRLQTQGICAKSHWHLWWVKKVYHHCVPAVRQLLRPGRDRRGRHTELIGLVQAEPKISFRKASSNYKAPAIHWAACSTFQGISSAGLSVSSSCQLK